MQVPLRGNMFPVISLFQLPPPPPPFVFPKNTSTLHRRASSKTIFPWYIGSGNVCSRYWSTTLLLYIHPALLHIFDDLTNNRTLFLVSFVSQILRLSSASNPCAVNKGGCSHFCVAKSSGYECACPAGLPLKQDNKTCEGSTSFVFQAYYSL